MTASPVIAADVGNSRIKLGLFTDDDAALPEPKKLFAVGDTASFEPLDEWLAPHRADEVQWWIASVNRRASARLVEWLRERAVGRIVLVTSRDLPLAIHLPRPDMVGIDRLVDAVAANRLRPVGAPAVIADLGTAITVDLLDRQGAFIGGTILPGTATSARAMHEFTDMLPLIDTHNFAGPPAVLGEATVAALEAGLYWGAVGAIRELTARLAAHAGAEPAVFLTGGGADAVAGPLSDLATHVPTLTLSGIALAAAHAGL